MTSKLRLSKLGIVCCVVVFCTLVVGSFVQSGLLLYAVLIAIVAILFIGIPIFLKLGKRISEIKSITGYALERRKWALLFSAFIVTGFALTLFFCTFIENQFLEVIGIGLLFSIPCAMYLFLASQSAALKSIGMENFYWIGGIALYSCVFLMLYTMEREFYSAVLFLFVASVAILLFSFIYPHLKRQITKKDNLPYLVSSAGFTMLVSYSAVMTLLRNYKMISAGYQFMDFAFIIIFYAMIIVGIDMDFETYFPN